MQTVAHHLFNLWNRHQYLNDPNHDLLRHPCSGGSLQALATARPTNPT